MEDPLTGETVHRTTQEEEEENSLPLVAQYVVAPAIHVRLWVG